MDFGVDDRTGFGEKMSLINRWLSDTSQALRVVVLLLLSGAAALLWVATPWLIHPFPHDVPWYASPAMFPRMALGVMALAGFWEVLRHRRGATSAGSDELDAGEVDLRMVAQAVVAFAVYTWAVPVVGFLSSSVLFLVVCGRIVRLSWRQSALLGGPLAVFMWAIFEHVLGVAFGHGLLI
jgi:Tripartite tricarboxylate transporter TctB family